MTFSKISSLMVLGLALLHGSPALAQSAKGIFVADMACDHFDVVNPDNHRTETYSFSLASGMEGYEKSGPMIASMIVESRGSYPDTVLATGSFTRTSDISRFDSVSKFFRIQFIAKSKDPTTLNSASIKIWLKNEQNKWELGVDQIVNCTAVHQGEGGSVGSHNK